MTDLKTLKEKALLAQKAYSKTYDSFTAHEFVKTMETYHKATKPPTVLALVECIERVRELTTPNVHNGLLNDFASSAYETGYDNGLRAACAVIDDALADLGSVE